MNRALVHEIPVLSHFLDIIGDVRSQIAASQRDFSDCHLGITNVEQHYRLHAVDVVYAEAFELKFHNLQQTVMEALDKGIEFKIKVLCHLSSASDSLQSSMSGQ